MPYFEEGKYAEGDVRNTYCPFLSTGARKDGWVLCIGDACGCFRERHSLSVDNPTRMPGHAKQEIKKIGYCGAGGKP